MSCPEVRGAPCPPVPTSANTGRPESRSLFQAALDSARELSNSERAVDRMLHTAQSEKIDERGLLAIQAGVYHYSQQFELASKLIDKTTNSIKQTLQGQ